MQALRRGNQEGVSEKFRTSSFCASNECLAVAMHTNGLVHVRDTKDKSKQMLIFAQNEWAAFIKGVKYGEFELS